jgi:hypothetical protein
MRVTFQPLVWDAPQTPASSRRSRHTLEAPWHDTVDLLDHELRHLGATLLVIEADFTESDIGPDGMPLTGARQPIFPGVRLAFECRHGPLAYQTDICSFWQHNVFLIASGLEALRAVDRHGITSGAQQYLGFRTAGPGPATPTSGKQHFPDALSALRWLRHPDVCGLRGAEGAAIKSVLRLVARNTHPDHGGTREQWENYQEAHRLLSEAGMI